MSLISNFHRVDNEIQFKIKNKNTYKVCLINALRRIILANLNTYSIDRDSVKFYENSSIFNDDYLSHRLSLIPCFTDFFEKKDADEVRFECNKTNDNIDIFNLTAKDIEVFYKDEKIDNSKVFTFPDSIICRLKYKNHLHFSCKIKKGSLKEGGAGFSPVSQVSYNFERDEGKIKEVINEMKKKDEIKNDLEADNFILKKGDRIYKTEKNAEPSIYNFTIESTGVIKVKDIFRLACDYLIDKCNKNINNEIYSEESKINMKAYDFIFEDEDDTLGNLLQKYLFDDSNVDYVGYLIPHPMERKMNLRISLKKDKFTDKDCRLAINNILKKIIKITKELKDSYLANFK